MLSWVWGLGVKRAELHSVGYLQESCQRLSKDWMRGGDRSKMPIRTHGGGFGGIKAGLGVLGYTLGRQGWRSFCRDTLSIGHFVSSQAGGRGSDGDDDEAGSGSASKRHRGRASRDEIGRNFGRGGPKVTPPQGRGGCFRNRAVDAKWPENPNTLNISYLF
jgi:hypothetical protein